MNIGPRRRSSDPPDFAISGGFAARRFGVTVPLPSGHGSTVRLGPSTGQIRRCSAVAFRSHDRATCGRLQTHCAVGPFASAGIRVNRVCANVVAPSTTALGV